MAITATTAIILVAAAVSAASALAQAEAQAKAAEFNAAAQRQQAQREQQIAARDADEFGRSASRLIAGQRALFSGSGIAITGTPLGVIEDTVATAEFEQRNILAGGDVRAAGLRMQAKLSDFNARNARAAGGFKAVTTLATGASGFFGGFGAPPPPIAPSTSSFVAGQLQ